MTRHRLLAALVCGLAVVAVSVVLTNRAGAGADVCTQFRSAATEPARTRFAGAGDAARILVIGDSYSLGLGVDASQSWPHRLPGQVVVDGFSGSGLSKDASGCGDLSYASRAAQALHRAGAVDLVVIEGGLNDYDQPTEAVRAGFESLLDRLGDRPVLVVGPAPAPSRAEGAVRIDALLARSSAQRGVRYVSMVDARFPYLSDRLHLTAAGHRAFGELVAATARVELGVH